MKHITHIIVLLAALLTMVPGMAQTTTDSNQQAAADSVYLYKTWESVIYDEPFAVVINPIIVVNTPYDVAIADYDGQLAELINKELIAASLGDSVWLINSEYLQSNFTGDAKKFENFVPFYFNDKAAFAVFVGYEASVGKQILGGLMGDTEMFDSDPFTDEPEYYNIDFENKTVTKVTHKTLPSILNDYHDLKMRYEGMKDYKKREIVQDYYLQYIERLTQDPTKPDIIELMMPVTGIE